MFIDKIKQKYLEGEPIFIKDILLLFPNFTKAYVFRLINEAEESNQIAKCSRGVYCLPKETYFGYRLASPSSIARSKYITDGNSVYGIFGGLSILNQFSMTNQVPNTIEIITNNEATRRRIIEIGKMKYILKKSRFPITKDNYNYYTILELFLEIDNKEKLDDFSKKEVISYIVNNNLDKNKLIQLSLNFPSIVLKNLVESEVLNGII